MNVPTLQQQCAAVARAAVNMRGHVENLRNLAARGRRSQKEYEMAASWLPDLEAAARTMHDLAKRGGG